VNQKYAARINAKPGVTSFDQIARLVTALGGRLFVELPEEPVAASAAAKPVAKKTAKAKKPAATADTW
jgi:hypothetical protein